MKKAFYFLFTMLCIGSHCKSQEFFRFKGDDKQSSISAYWYNCKTDTAVESAINDTTFIRSSLQIYGPVLADSFYVEAEVFLPTGEKAYGNKFSIKKGMHRKDFRIDMENNYFLMTVPAYQLSKNPGKIKITLSSAGERLERWIQCKYHKLSGHMTDFKGNSLKSYILISASSFEDVSGVWSDANGDYEIDLPERTYNCFYINDGKYKSTTLEAWAWNIVMDEDQKLDFKIGTGEVYNLNVWSNNGGGNAFFISFRPMVLFHNNTGDNRQEINQKAFKLINISPDLDIKDLTVTINGKRAELISLQKYFETGYSDQAMPAYLIQVRKSAPYLCKQTIRVEYEKTIEKDNKKVFQNSMGYFQLYPVF